MPHNPFPDPAAVLPGEVEMLSAVLANLTDDLPKLVYADWLEERGDPRGVFLRQFTTAARSGGKLPRPKKLSKAWLDLVGWRLVAVARKHGWETASDQLFQVARPAVTFTSKKAKDATLPIGVSKFGGDPDVSPKFKWPEYEAGVPLAFLAQFNLADLSVSPAVRELPSGGLLSVFVALSNRRIFSEATGVWRVFHFPNVAGVSRRTPPDDFDQANRSQSCQLTFAEVLALPERYEEGNYDPNFKHLLLGHTRWIQGEPTWATEKKKGRPKYRHLLTLDSDKHPDWMWGDCGSLYFGISADDLKAGRFDRTKFEMQCS